MSSEHALRPSEEVDERHLELARAEGEAYQRAARHMIEEVADTGGMEDAGEYVVGFAQEKAEGLYRFEDDRLEWQEPEAGANCHLEVLVAESETGRLLPEMSPQVILRSEDGETFGPFEIPFVWHPGLLHYGRNLELPGDGTYEIEIEVDAPTFPRHDEQNGDRFTEPVAVTFEDVDIETGRS